jgi:hypothetical protein
LKMKMNWEVGEETIGPYYMDAGDKKRMQK